MKNITCPPASKIASELNLDEETALKIRAYIKAGYSPLPGRNHYSHAAIQFMEGLSKLGDFQGVESLYPDRPEVFYCNAGDTYAATLIFNRETAQVRLGCWGDLVGA